MDERDKLRVEASRIRAGLGESHPETAGSEKAEATDAPDIEQADGDPPAFDISAAPSEIKIAELEAQVGDLTERLLRAAAEMDNLRKRSEREVTDARRYAVSKFAGDMLVVNDNLQRALNAIPDDQAEATSAMTDLVKGVEVTSRELVRALEKYGVMEIPAMGEKFNPHMHEALFEAPIPGTPDGTIIEVVEKGYLIGDRVLRAAKVGIAKGGQAAQATPHPPQPN